MKVPLLVKFAARVKLPLVEVNAALAAMVTLPLKFKVGLYVAAVAVRALVPLPMVKVPPTVSVCEEAVPKVYVTVPAGVRLKLL